MATDDKPESPEDSASSLFSPSLELGLGGLDDKADDADGSEGSDDSEREDSGLQDILSVAAQLKSKKEAEAASEKAREDSGLIVFSAGDFGSSDDAGAGDGESSDQGESEDEGESDLFGNFSGSLGAGFGTSTDPLVADLEAQGGEGSVREARPAEAAAKPAEDSKRNPLVAVAVVLGLALVGTGVVVLTGKDKPPVDHSAEAEMSANSGPAVAGVEAGDEPEAAEAGAAEAGGAEAGGAEAGVAGETEGAFEAAAGETEGVLAGETEGMATGGLLADADDPMAQKAGLLDGSDKPAVKPAGKWDPGSSGSGGGSGGSGDSGGSDPAPSEPDPVVAPEPDPVPEPPKTTGGSAGDDDEVDCLLNPDLPKCQSGGSDKPKTNEVLAPKLPEKLGSKELRSGFNKIKSKARACGSKHGAETGTKVRVHVSIEGATGKVSEVKAKGEHAGTPLGNCVEGVVKGATFDKFKRSSMGIDYSLIM